MGANLFDDDQLLFHVNENFFSLKSLKKTVEDVYHVLKKGNLTARM